MVSPITLTYVPLWLCPDVAAPILSQVTLNVLLVESLA